jgi:hypothetical protein
MIPGNSLSNPTEYAPFLYGDSLPTTNHIDYEMGGIAIQDASQGLQYQLWQAALVGNNVILTPQITISSPVTIYSGNNITEISFTFDQNMTPFLAFVQDGTAKYYWYDNSLHSYTTVSLPSGVTNPRVCLDDKRAIESALGHNDIILAYIRSNNLCFRMQRQRFLTEYVLATNVNATLVKIGMNTVNRLQFELMRML